MSTGVSTLLELTMALMSGGAMTPVVYDPAPSIRAVPAALPDDPNSGGASMPVPIGNPGVWFGPAAYPPAALRAGAQGRVVAQVGVDTAGRPVDCAITQSSGSSDLDAATCLIARQRMTFTPARDPAGNTIAGQYRLAVRWQLPAGPAASPMATTLVSIGADGTVLSCASTVPTPLGDICGAFPTGRKLDVPEAMRGKVFAIGTMVRPLAE